MSYTEYPLSGEVNITLSVVKCLLKNQPSFYLRNGNVSKVKMYKLILGPMRT